MYGMDIERYLGYCARMGKELTGGMLYQDLFDHFSSYTLELKFVKSIVGIIKSSNILKFSSFRIIFFYLVNRFIFDVKIGLLVSKLVSET